MDSQPALDLEDNNIIRVDLSELLLDPSNPRFGSEKGDKSKQSDILDTIVKNFTIEDVLSSISVNGYFPSEPLICYRDGDKYIVAEGNRRLAACLILAGDERAKNWVKRTDAYRKVWEAHGKKIFNPVPILAFDKKKQEKELLSYLGVRHIAGSQKWDSYAKAAWVAEVVDNSQLSIKDVISMIGDSTGTAVRLLEGYYLVNQLQKENFFEPKNSIRKGRGSSADFPFSWVYTLIGYSAVREFLKLEDSAEPAKEPLKRESLEDAAMLLDAMFGNRAKGQAPQLGDSRQLGELARVVADNNTVEQLRSGKAIKEIALDLLPIERRLFSNLSQARNLLKDVVGVITENPLAIDVAENLLEQIRHIRLSAKDINSKLMKTIESIDDDEL